MQMSPRADSGEQPIAQVIQRNLREIGLKPEVQELPVAEWYKRVFNPDANFDLAVSWFAGYGDPSIIMNWWIPQFAGFNRGWLKPMEPYSPLMDNIRQTPEGAERDTLLAEACKLALDGANMLALVNKPDLVFADEPTGNLDSNAATGLLEFLRGSVREFGQSIVMVTHDPRGAAYADRVVFLADGAVVSELRQPTADSVLERMRTLGG